MTEVAGLKLTLPPWLAVIEHVPVLRSITTTLAVLQTPGVVEVKLTGRPELALAAITNGEIPKILLEIVSNDIVWAVCAASCPIPDKRPITKTAPAFGDLFIMLFRIQSKAQGNEDRRKKIAAP